MYERVSRAPEAGDEPPPTMQPLSLTQRLNRLRFCCYMLTGAVLFNLIVMLLVIFSRATFMPQAGQIALAACQAGLSLAFLVWSIGLWVRRLHDLDRSGWWTLLFWGAPPLGFLFALAGPPPVLVGVLPVVAYLIYFYLLLAPGTYDANRFGAPNPPNGVLVQVFGGFWWAVQLLLWLTPVIFLVVAVFVGDESMRAWMKDLVEQMQQLAPVPSLPGTGD